MPLQATSGAASYDAFGGGAAAVPQYIEDVFSTYLYTGNSPSTQSIVNGIDLSTYGGMVWVKNRYNVEGYTLSHILMDTDRGTGNYNILYSNSASGNQTLADAGISSFNSNGFSLRYDDGYGTNFPSGGAFASWTFRKKTKFFDVVTYEGTGSNTTIAHSLGSVPACILVKRIETSGDWQVYHRSLANTEYLVLNSTAAKATGTTRWNSTTPTSTVFSVGTDATVNASGGKYVAYLFAHDAGGFGLTGTDNVISCGSYTGTGASGNAITLGYEPQWLIIKRATGGETSPWFMLDNMRGMPVSSAASPLFLANTSAAESSAAVISPNATGFTVTSTGTNYNGNGSTYIYIAIRRGPMKVPTSGTSVFAPFYVNASSGTAQTTNFPVDWQWGKPATGAANFQAPTRLLGVSTLPTSNSQPILFPTTSGAESFATGRSYNWTNTTFGIAADFDGIQTALWAWRRAPSYFDVVAYTGTGSSMTISHNLGVSPELIIGKTRSNAVDWNVSAFLSGFTDGVTSGFLNASNRFDPSNADSFFDPVSSTTFTHNPNTSARTYVAYLFATCAGVSKVGSYTGTGALQTVACGFTTGARFLLIKRTDDVGDWYIWDSARGISSGNDPYFVISTANEVTNTNYVDTDTTGFKVTAAASTTVNISAATYIFLAIA